MVGLGLRFWPTERGGVVAALGLSSFHPPGNDMIATSGIHFMNPWSQGKTQTLAVVGEKGIATEVGLLMMMDGPEKVPLGSATER